MSLAIFDLDNTLIKGDSDYLWGTYLVENDIVDKTFYAESNDKFYRQYKDGCLNIDEYLQFSLKPLADHPPEKLYAWRESFVEEKIKPLILNDAQKLIEKHQKAGDTLMVITATNFFVTEPIVKLYGIDHLIATQPEFKEGRYTGDYEGIPSFQAGKVKRLHQWLDQNQHTLEDSWFYSDSQNDIPLLSCVTHPVAVDPDAALKSFAEAKGWPIISLRGL